MVTSDPRNLYLDLLKRVLTDTVFAAEPNADDGGMEYLQGFINHYIRGRALTMVPLVRLDNLHRCALDVIERQVPGDFIEAGVWRGGTTIFMRAVLEAYAANDRQVWVADSFEGLPEPNSEKYPIEAKTHHGPVMSSVYDHFAVELEVIINTGHYRSVVRFRLDRVFLRVGFGKAFEGIRDPHLPVVSCIGFEDGAHEDCGTSTPDASLDKIPRYLAFDDIQRASVKIIQSHQGHHGECSAADIVVNESLQVFH